MRPSVHLRLAALLLSLFGAACAAHGKSTTTCTTNADCLSDNCFEGTCICASVADCAPDESCGVANCTPGISCGGATTCFVPYTGDAGCYSNHLQTNGPACPAGTSCDQTSGNCLPTTLAYPTCGRFDESYGYDGGWGPGPSAGGGCADCIGCPTGTECVCGVSGQLGGISCGPGNDNLAAATACFLTGQVGTCEIFAGDCATNSQCTGTPATPYCSSAGSCVQCLRDSQCPQGGGPQGCSSGQCSPCCTSNAQCPTSSPACIQGFCYAQCTSNAECTAPDAGGPNCCGSLCRSEGCDGG